MLIDTSHIDHLRVNFVAHFNTENNTLTATNEIETLIDNYPKEMTSQIRQWLNEQQRPRAAVSSSTIDPSKTIVEFEDYLKELEDNFLQCQQHEHNQTKLKVCFVCFRFKENIKLFFIEINPSNR